MTTGAAQLISIWIILKTMTSFFISLSSHFFPTKSFYFFQVEDISTLLPLTFFPQLAVKSILIVVCQKQGGGQLTPGHMAAIS